MIALYSFALVRAWRDAARSGNRSTRVWACLGFLLVATLASAVIRTVGWQAFRIPSGAMLPTLQIGDHILVNKFVYGPRLARCL